MKDSPNLLDGYYQSTLEEDLGRALTPEEFGSIKDLNEIPEQCVEQLRKLSGIEAEYFLEYLWHWEPRDDAKLVTIRYFLNDVVSRGEDPRSWRRGGAFFPNGGDGEWLFQSSITEILRDLEKKPNETWVVFPVPDQLLSLDCDIRTGSPACAAKNAALSAMFRMLPPATASRASLSKFNPSVGVCLGNTRRHISARCTTSGKGNVTTYRNRRKNAISKACFMFVVNIATPTQWLPYKHHFASFAVGSRPHGDSVQKQAVSFYDSVRSQFC